MPVDHGHLQAIGETYAGGFADLIAPAVLQNSEDDHNDHGKNDDDRRELAFFERQFHDAFRSTGVPPAVLLPKHVSKTAYGTPALQCVPKP